jgi:hypothetical protein
MFVVLIEDLGMLFNSYNCDKSAEDPFSLIIKPVEKLLVPLNIGNDSNFGILLKFVVISFNILKKLFPNKYL